MLADELYDLGAIKFGTFTLKSGISSPFYIDLRLAISSPPLLIQIGETLWNLVKATHFDLVCGVPYTALPFATVLSVHHAVPMILKRKEKKEYGTGKMCEGIFKKGERCLVIEDVITSGQSILDTINALENEGLIVQDIAVLIDREQGGRQLLEGKGYRLHSVFTISHFALSLFNRGKIDATAASAICSFISR